MSNVYKPTAVITSSEPVSDFLSSLESWTDIVAAVNANNGVMVVTMEVLRDVDGYGRLGSTVRANIARKLSSVGLGYLCGSELPNESTATIILYRLGTPAANLIDALTTAITSGNSSEETATELRKLNIMPDPEAIREGVMIVLHALDNSSNRTKR